MNGPKLLVVTRESCGIGFFLMRAGAEEPAVKLAIAQGRPVPEGSGIWLDEQRGTLDFVEQRRESVEQRALQFV